MDGRAGANVCNGGTGADTYLNCQAISDPDTDPPALKIRNIGTVSGPAGFTAWAEADTCPTPGPGQKSWFVVGSSSQGNGEEPGGGNVHLDAGEVSGSWQAVCRDEPSNKVTASYESVDYTVTGPTPTFTGTPNLVSPGTAFEIHDGGTGCGIPGFQYVTIVLMGPDPSGSGRSGHEVARVFTDAAGKWTSVQVAIPSDAMPDPEYFLNVNCYAPVDCSDSVCAGLGWWIRYVHGPYFAVVSN